MKLFFSVNSPYARKCRVVAAEKGLADKIEYIQVAPMENPPELLAVNPLACVPALATDDGMALCESPVICEYLDSLSPKNPLIPSGNGRFQVLALAALADGVMDAAVACVLEGRRPEDKRSMEWVIRKETAIKRVIAVMAQELHSGLPLSMGTINTAVALSYVNFRLPGINWTGQHPELALWLEQFSSRDSMKSTKPVA